MSSNALYDYKILSSIALENNLNDVANFINERQINRIALMGLNDDLLKKIIPEDYTLRSQMDFFIKNIIPKTNAFDTVNRNYLLKKYKRRTKSCDAINIQLKKPWPSSFEYPKHRLDKAILNKLESQEELTHRDTINLIQALFLELKEYIKFYATAGIYEDAAKSIITAYPYLKDNSETGFNSYRVQLKNKFKEYRRSLENPEILSKRVKFGKRKLMENSRKRRRPNKKFENLEEADLNDENLDSNNDTILEEPGNHDDSDSIDSNVTEEEGFVERYKSNSSFIINRNDQLNNTTE